MQLKLVRNEEYNIFVLKGELMRMNSRLFSQKMIPYAEREPYMVIDLNAVDFMDSGGLSVLMELSNRLRERGYRLWLYRPNADIRRVIHNTHVGHLFKITNDLDEILRSIRPLHVANTPVENRAQAV